MNGFCVHTENSNHQEDNRDIKPNFVLCSQTLIRQDESNSSDRDDDLKIPNLEESLSMLKEQGDRVGILFHLNRHQHLERNASTTRPKGMALRARNSSILRLLPHYYHFQICLQILSITHSPVEFPLSAQRSEQWQKD